MKKLLLVFVGLLCSLVISAQTNFQELSLEKAREQARAENKPIFLDCYTSWCGPCKMLSPVLRELAEENAEALKVGKINVDEQRELAMRFQVSSIPMLVVFKDGKAVAKSVGYRPKSEIAAMLESAK